MQVVKLTAEFTTSVSRYITVDDDFDPRNTDLDDLWFAHGGSSLCRSELEEASGNLEFDEVWLVRNNKDEDMFVK